MSDLLNEASLVLIPSGTKASKVYSQIPEDGSGDMTFSRASDATRVNSLGLVEKVRTNMLSYSEDFGNAYYTKNRSSITTNTTTAPNGTTTADSLIESTANGTHEFILVIAVVQQAYTFSIYSKANTRNKIQLVLAGTPFASGGNGEVSFDLSAGSIISAVNGATGKIESVGSGWYRCSITKLASVADPSGVFAVRLLDSSGNSSYTGDGTSFAYFWGAQFELSDFGPTAYIPTTSSAVSVGPYSNIPRLNYQNGGGGCPSLLLEAQRTNLITYSEQMNNGAYGKGDGIAVGSNVEVSPDGYQDADKIYTNTTVNGDHYFNRNPFTSVSSSTAYTFSIFAKKGEFNYINFESTIENNTYKGATINLNNGAVTNNTYSTTPLVENYGNGWYRISISGTTGASQTSVDTYIIVLNNSQQRFYTGDGVSGIYTWGWQLEAGSFVSSYIPTLGTSVTRVADACYKTGISSLIGQTSGTIFVDFVWDGLGTAAVDNSLLSLGYQEYGTSYITIANYSGGLYGRITVGINVEANMTFGAMSIGTRYKAAFAYANNDVVFYVNGVNYGTDTNASIPATSNVYFQNDYPNFKEVNQAVIFPTRLTNLQLQELTS